MAASKFDAVKEKLTEGLLSDQVTPSAARRISEMLKELAQKSITEKRLDAMERELEDIMGNLIGPTVDEIKMNVRKGKLGIVETVKVWFRSRRTPLSANMGETLTPPEFNV